MKIFFQRGSSRQTDLVQFKNVLKNIDIDDPSVVPVIIGGSLLGYFIIDTNYLIDSKIKQIYESIYNEMIDNTKVSQIHYIMSNEERRIRWNQI